MENLETNLAAIEDEAAPKAAPEAAQKKPVRMPKIPFVDLSRYSTRAAIAILLGYNVVRSTALGISVGFAAETSGLSDNGPMVGLTAAALNLASSPTFYGMLSLMFGSQIMSVVRNRRPANDVSKD